MIFLGYKLIEARLSVEQNGLERQLGAVVGVKLQFGGPRVRKGESSQGARDGGGCGSQTGLPYKLTTVGVNDLAVIRFRRLLVSTQTRAPLIGTVVAKLTPRPSRVKILRPEAGADPSRWSG